MGALKSVMKVLSISALMAVVTNVQAGLVSFSVTGLVDNTPWTVAPNDFGLSAGDTISAYGVFDDVGINGVGPESVAFGLGSGNTMSLDVGNFSFTETDDTFYATGFPKLLFNNGIFDGINFDVTIGLLGSFNSAGSLQTFTGFDDVGFGSIDGHWDANSFTASPVPVPAAAWLFGSGLLGLVGVARRKK